jgi:hypothetical protein
MRSGDRLEGGVRLISDSGDADSPSNSVFPDKVFRGSSRCQARAALGFDTS